MARNATTHHHDLATNRHPSDVDREANVGGAPDDDQARVHDPTPLGPAQEIRRWWTTRYEAIMRDLGFSIDDDARAARRLAELLADHPRHVRGPTDPGWPHLEGHVMVTGAADSLLDDLSAAQRITSPHSIIVADTSLTPLTATEHTPDLIVTDLDGDENALLEASRDGIPLAIHAHGDNIERLERLVPAFEGPVLGTGQHPAACDEHHLLCPGGFSDGDRAVFLARHLGATLIQLVGFDLEGPPGTLAGKPATPTKRKKLRWAARNLDDAESLGIPLEGRR